MQPAKQLERLEYKLGVDSHTTEFASGIHTACEAAGLANGRSTEVIVTACLYVAVRELEQPVSLSDIEAASGIEMNRLVGAYQTIIGGLSIQLEPERPTKYVTEYVRRLDDEFDAHLGTPVVEQATEILQRSRGYTSSTASGVAAGAVYVAADLENKRLTQEEVAQAASISPSTVRENALVHRAMLEDL